MKNTSSLFLTFISYLFALAAILFLVFATLPLRAQTATSAEVGTNNAVVAVPESQTMTSSASASNAVATAETKVQKPSKESSLVRIDDAGIHVGGQNPADNNKLALGGIAIGALALLVPFAPFVMVIAIVAIVFYFKHRRNKMVHETMLAMIEKGVPVTPELIAQLRNGPSGSSANRLGQQLGRSRHRHLLPGLILTGVGTALLISHPGYHSSGGWIVLFIGVAFLIVWFVERRDKNNDQPPKQ